MDRRQFLTRAAAAGTAAALGRNLVLSGASAYERPPYTGAVDMLAGSILNDPASVSPVKHIVVLMMENRSFDHYLGWLADDDTYMAAGETTHGPGFHIDSWRANVPDLTYENHNLLGSAGVVAPRHWTVEPGEENPYRGCHHPDPGHSWIQGRSQKQNGFLGHDSRNDDFALGYYLADDVETYAHLARGFTVFDHYHCSLMAPTFPNREYMHSASSGGLQTNKIPEYQPTRATTTSASTGPPSGTGSWRLA